MQQSKVDEIATLLKARCTLLWVATPEEGRAERTLLDAAAAARYGLYLWDCDGGLMGASGEPIEPGLVDPRAMLRAIGESQERAVYVLRDLHQWLDPIVLRALRSLARKLQTEAPARSIVFLSPSAEIPPTLAAHAVPVEFPLPDRQEIGEMLDRLVDALPDETIRANATGGERERAVDAAVGLMGEHAGNAYACSLVSRKRVDPAAIVAEKRRAIAGIPGLTFYPPDPRGLDAIGGLGGLESYLAPRRDAFSEAARAYGLPAPKGILLVGRPGCGKSLAAKSVAGGWGMPLLRLDLGGAKSKFVGESEGNIRRALSLAETLAPCVLWVDEIEKALAGASGPQGDGGVGADALAVILSWQQERAGAVFLVATANDVRALPPELLRKGRFDEIFYVGTPTREERRAIVATALRAHGRELGDDPSLGALLDRTEGWSGAEIAALVPAALFAAFADGARPLTLADLLAAAAETTPLAETERDREVREWARGRARLASLPDTSERAPRGGRALDLA